MKKLIFYWFAISAYCSEADLIVFSYNRPMQLYAFLESLEKNVTNLHTVSCVLRSDIPYQSGYQVVEGAFPNVRFIRQSENPKSDFKPIVMELLFGALGQAADHVLFAVDDIIITDQFDVKDGISILHQTGAYGLYYRLGKHVNYCYALNSYQGLPSLLPIKDGYYCWQFNSGQDDWKYPNTVDLTLYRKSDLIEIFRNLSFSYPNDLEGNWASLADYGKIGICCERAKMINLPINIVSEWKNRSAQTYSTEELNELFMRGLKIDVDQYYQILNPSAHVDYKLEFIPR